MTLSSRFPPVGSLPGIVSCLPGSRSGHFATTTKLESCQHRVPAPRMHAGMDRAWTLLPYPPGTAGGRGYRSRVLCPAAVQRRKRCTSGLAFHRAGNRPWGLPPSRRLHFLGSTCSEVSRIFSSSSSLKSVSRCPSLAMEICPVSSEVTITKASDSSDNPRAARWRVP